MNDEDKQTICDEIYNLSNDKHVELFKIFKKHNVPFSENKNGIFINLNSVDSEIMKEVREYLVYIEKQEKMINDFENEKQMYKENLA